MNPIGIEVTKMSSANMIKQYALWIASAIGAILIFHFAYGLEVIVPTNISWLMTANHDWGTHYLGWHFYKEEGWQFPLGNINNYYYPTGTNIGFTDSIPLFALFFKLFAKILPNDFQYFGLWLLLCHLLAAYYTVLLFRQFKVKDIYTFLAVIVIAANPVLIYRGMHPALCAHWLLIASLYLYFSDNKFLNVNKVLVYQLVLLLISALVNPYLTIMILGFTFITPLKLAFFEKKLLKNHFFAYEVVSVGLLLVIWYVVGLLTFGNREELAVQGGFGLYSLNLNALYNSSGFSSYLPSLPQTSPHQYEGYMYLGLGVMVLLLFLFFYGVYILVLSRRNNSQGIATWKRLNTLIPLGILIILFTLFSLTHVITFNSSVLLSVTIPEQIVKLGEVFRASARFFWVPYYLILIFSIVLLTRIQAPKALKVSLLAFAVLLQLNDTKAIFQFRNLSYGSYKMPVDSKHWTELISKFDRIEFYPPFQTTNLSNADYQYFCYLAANLGKPINTGYVARGANKATEAYYDSLTQTLAENRISPGSLYITTPAYINRFSHLFHDGTARLNVLDDYYYIFSSDVSDSSLVKLADRLNAQNKQTLDSALEKFGKKELFTELTPVRIFLNGDIRMNLEKLVDQQKYLSLSGFAFNNRITNSKRDSVFFTLKGNGRLYLARALVHPRPDVTSYFQKAYLDNAGFNTTIFKEGIARGSYILGVAIKDGTGNFIHQSTDRIIKVGLSEFATLAVVDTSLFKRNANIRASLEHFEIWKDHLTLSGWGFLWNQSTDNLKIGVVLQGRNKTVGGDTEPVIRTDVTEFFKSGHNLNGSGFRVKILTGDLSKGKYRIGITIKRNNTDKTYLHLFEKDIMID